VYSSPFVAVLSWLAIFFLSIFFLVFLFCHIDWIFDRLNWIFKEKKYDRYIDKNAILSLLQTFCELSKNPDIVDIKTSFHYNDLVKDIENLTGSNLRSFKCPISTAGWSQAIFFGKLNNLVAFWNNYYSIDDKVVEIGTLFRSIQDLELRDRCIDILSAKQHFDRVVNQATLVLEERLRKKSGLVKAYGVDLVNKAINSKPENSVLIISQDVGEQEGFANICRGVVMLYRNPTHHKIVQHYSREKALNICLFIDTLLKTIDTSKKIRKK